MIENEEKKKEISNMSESIRKLKVSIKNDIYGDLILEKSQLLESIDSISTDV